MNLNLPCGDSTRAWKICGFVSILLHVLLLGATGNPLPAHFTNPHDAGISIDLDLVVTAPAQPAVPKTPVGPEQPRQTQAAPENEVEPMPDLKKAEAPKPKPKKTAPPKPAPQKTATSRERVLKKPGTGASSTPAGTPAKTAGSQASAPVPADRSSSPRPPYPELARKRGQEGTVNVCCQVDSSGQVTAVSLAKSSGFKLLDEAALNTVRKWKFKPGIKDGASVAGTVIVPVQFKLQ